MYITYKSTTVNIAHNMLDAAERLTLVSEAVAARRFEQQEAVFGQGGKDTAATRFADQGIEVGLGIEPEQRQPKAALARRRAVTGSRAAALAGKSGKDALAERNALVGETGRGQIAN